MNYGQIKGKIDQSISLNEPDQQQPVILFLFFDSN